MLPVDNFYTVGDFVKASDPWGDADSPGIPAWSLSPLSVEIDENNLVWIPAGERGFVVEVDNRLHRILFDNGLFWVDAVFLEVL